MARKPKGEVEIIPPAPIEKKKLGRPTIWTEEIASAICAELSRGFSLSEICRREKMPDITVVYDVMRRDPSFAQRYTRAKQDSADTYASMIIDAAKGPFNDMLEVQAARLKIDTLKWVAAKLKPKSYGERVEAAITGADGGPIQVQAVPLDAAKLDPDARDALRQALIAATVATKREDEGE